MDDGHHVSGPSGIWGAQVQVAGRGWGTHNQEAEVRLPDLDLPPVGKAALEKSLPFCQDGRGAQGSLPAESVHCSPSGGEGPSLLGEKRSVHDAKAHGGDGWNLPAGHRLDKTPLSV